MLRKPWLLASVFLLACRSTPTEPTPASAKPAVAPASASAVTPPPAPSATSATKDTTYAKHSAAALVSECIERTWFGYLCNNAYEAAADHFPADAATIRSLMRLAVRVDAGKPLGGEGEVASACDVEKGEGNAYPCLYVADGDDTARGKAAHALACKGAPPAGQVPVAGGKKACDGDKPIVIKPLPRSEAEDVKRCFACGNTKETSNRDLTKLASQKACARVRKLVAEREAKLIEQSIEPLCPKGS